MWPCLARYGAERSSMRLGRILCSFPSICSAATGTAFYRKHVLRDFSPVALFMLTGPPSSPGEQASASTRGDSPGCRIRSRRRER